MGPSPLPPLKWTLYRAVSSTTYVAFSSRRKKAIKANEDAKAQTDDDDVDSAAIADVVVKCEPMEEDLDDVDEAQYSINPDVDIKQENEEIKEEDDELSSSLQKFTKVGNLYQHFVMWMWVLGLVTLVVTGKHVVISQRFGQNTIRYQNHNILLSSKLSLKGLDSAYPVRGVLCTDGDGGVLQRAHEDGAPGRGPRPPLLLRHLRARLPLRAG